MVLHLKLRSDILLIYHTHLVMPIDSTNIYPTLKDFIHELVGDKISSMRIVSVLGRADVPLQTFITAVKLYRMVLNRSNRMRIVSKGIRSGRSEPSEFRTVLSSEEHNVLRDQYLVFVTCCVIASKYYRDIAFTNESWESVSEIKMQNLNETERLCLIVLDYQVSSQDDHLVHEVVAGVLKRSGIEISEGAMGRPGRIKMLMRKILCFN